MVRNFLYNGSTSVGRRASVEASWFSACARTCSKCRGITDYRTKCLVYTTCLQLTSQQVRHHHPVIESSKSQNPKLQKMPKFETSTGREAQIAVMGKRIACQLSGGTSSSHLLNKFDRTNVPAINGTGELPWCLEI